MNWYKESISTGMSQIVSTIAAMLRDAPRDSGVVDESRIYPIVSQIQDEGTLQVSLELALGMLQQTDLTPDQEQVVQSIRDAFYSQKAQQQEADDQEEQQKLQQGMNNGVNQEITEGVPQVPQPPSSQQQQPVIPAQ